LFYVFWFLFSNQHLQEPKKDNKSNNSHSKCQPSKVKMAAYYMKKEFLMQKQKKKQHNIKRRHHKHHRTKQLVIEKQNIGNILEGERYLML
jgi:hypothetical protein